MLKDVLPALYYQHIIQLSHVMFKFQCEFISYADVDYLSTCMNNLVCTFEQLYGLEHMSYNVHLLWHMPDCIRNWGPLWCYSAYSFESANGLFLKLFHGTQAVSKQIASSFLLLQRIHEMVPFTVSSDTNHTYLKLLSKFVSGLDLLNVNKSLSFLGKAFDKRGSFGDILTIELFLGFSISIELKSFRKLIVNGQIYYSVLYTRNTKRCNSVVLLNDGSVVLITDFLRVTASITSEVHEICLVKLVQFHDSLIPNAGYEDLRNHVSFV